MWSDAAHRKQFSLRRRGTLIFLTTENTESTEENE